MTFFLNFKPFETNSQFPNFQHSRKIGNFVFYLFIFLIGNAKRMSHLLGKCTFDQKLSFFSLILSHLRPTVQVSSEYKMCRTFFEPPAPTDQTEHSRSMKFGMVNHWGNRSGAIEAIFDISPLTRDMGVGWGTPGGSKILKIVFPIFDFFGIKR